MCSIAASMATMTFNKAFNKNVEAFLDDYFFAWNNSDDDEKYMKALCNATDNGAMFDCRAFNIPKEEVCNLIYWRQVDATRNSIQMVGRAYFSHKELEHKSCSDIQDMLFKKFNVNWNDYPAYLKRGSACIKNDNGWYIDKEMPILKNEDRNYVDKLIYIND
jgi:tRNA(His) 5'-end guanylyltransferase